MQEKIINLEEILKGQIVGDSNLSVYDLVTKNSGLDISIKSAMLELSKQLLELAAENAKIKSIVFISGKIQSTTEIVDRQSIIDTNKQVII